MKTNIKRIDTLIALYNKSLATATHSRLMYIWNLLVMYAMEEKEQQNWVVMVVPCNIERVTGKLKVFKS